MTVSGALKARVRSGRLVLDEPTDLPDGTEVELVPVGTTMTDPGEGQDRDLVNAMIDGALDDSRAGRTRAVEEYLAERRARQ